MAEGGERFQRLSAAARVFHLSRKIYVRAAKWPGKHHLPAGISHFTLEVVFSEVWQSDLPVSASSLRLHCVPVINLFTLEADPLTISGLESEYLLRPKRLQDGHTEIYSVGQRDRLRAHREARYVLSPAFVTRDDASPCAGALPTTPA